ncbi:MULTISPECIES: helix-turn-helix domain-containing protein [Mesorhizobium]|uniref:helix-turn-helix domain-containing protein n=1 Tax=Mesorhizobium TaxID=68287 RepID=UPI0010A9796D|nr:MULTISPECIES: helix-turn-helix transcriptional regulator [Mesorhizobium]
MRYATEDIIQTLRGARKDKGLSQRKLSARVGLPQSHISKIESGATDLRLSSLVQLARSLDYEVVIVPRKALSAVKAVVVALSVPHKAISQPRAAYELNDDEDA